MSDATHHGFDHLRQSAAAVLPPCCQIEFQRLCKLIQTGADRFQFIVVDCRDERLRERVIASLDEVFGATRPSTRVALSASAFADFSELEAQLRAATEKHDIVHLVGANRWLDTARWESFNIRREALAQSVRASVLCWLDAEAIADMAHIATDLWAWRAGVIEFRSEIAAVLPPGPTQRPDDNRLSLKQRARRIAELKSALDAHPDLPADSDFDLSIELGTLLLSIGRTADAEDNFRALAARFADDAPQYAHASFELSAALMARGELDEALRLLQGEVLPAFDRLGDVRSKAVTMGAIADILQARGDLDEALRIRREEELPVYERLGDVREKAVTMGKIADILQARGDLDEALRIRREEVLPVYERLGDVRSKAMTMGKIADILQTRGELDEALRLLQGDVLPAFDRLGDVRSKAVTMGKIADILQARGDLDEALRIHQEDELPVYERLGDVASKVVTMGKIADILYARGQFDEALALHEQRLPTAERLGDLDSIAQTRFSRAVIRLQRGDNTPEAMQQIHDDLDAAFAMTQRLGRPDGIAASGRLLAEVLAARGETARALDVLDVAEAALRTLNDQAGLAEASALRARLVEQASPAPTPESSR